MLPTTCIRRSMAWFDDAVGESDSMSGKRRLCGMAILAGALLGCGPMSAQTPAECGPHGSRVIASRWDVVLQRGWEFRRDCAHPEWPARLIESASGSPAPAGGKPLAAATALLQLLVRAGDAVTLWQRDATVQIEMSGVAEQSARIGEPVVVRITRQNDDGGLIVDRIAGVVRGAGDVEMER